MLPRVDLIRCEEFTYCLLNSPDHIGSFIKQNGFWGKLESTVCSILVDGLESPVIIDAGANIGGFTLPIAKKIANLNGVIHSFEPQRIVFQQLCTNIFINRLDNVYTHNVALGDECKLLELPELNFDESQNVGGFSIDEGIRLEIEEDGKKGNNFTNKLENKKNEVRQITLDSLNLFKSIAFLKIDVEGFELELFKGSVETIKSNNFPPIIFEVWDKNWYANKALLTKEYLLNFGYTFYEFGRDIVAQHPKHDRYLVFEKNGNNVNIMLKLRN